jgi:hypothetical protein
MSDAPSTPDTPPDTCLAFYSYNAEHSAQKMDAAPPQKFHRLEMPYIPTDSAVFSWK